MTLYNPSETLARPSLQPRFDYPEFGEAPHPRAVEMADRMREERGAFGSCSFAGLVQAGFSTAEIIEHEPAARALAEAAFVRQIAPAGDRVPDIIEKAIASAAHRVPRLAGVEPPDDAADAWGRYCTARAAWKLDPWVSQQERCLTLLNAFLQKLGPLLPREINRITYALAASMKSERRAA